MTGTATGGIQAAPAARTTDLSAIAADVTPADDEAGAGARARLGAGFGRLSELAGWLAATQGTDPPAAPRRPRCVQIGTSLPAAAGLAELLDVGMQQLRPAADVPAAVQAGIALADDEVDAGADLVVLVAGTAEADPAAAAVLSVLRAVEPVALLPRGAAAVDSAAWSRRAAQLRDLRRTALRFRSRPDRLLAALGSATLAATAGFLLRATARRTPVVLDGTVAAAAALFVYDIAFEAVDWWQAADACPDPVQARACQELGLDAILAIGIGRPSGTAGLLTLPILRAAAAGWQ